MSGPAEIDVALAVRKAATQADWRDLFSRSRRDGRNLLRLLFSRIDAIAAIEPIGTAAPIVEVAGAICAFVVMGYSRAMSDSNRKRKALDLFFGYLGNWLFNATVPIGSPVRVRDQQGTFLAAEALKAKLLDICQDRYKFYSELMIGIADSPEVEAAGALASFKLGDAIREKLFGEDCSIEAKWAALETATSMFDVYVQASHIGR